MKCSGLTYRKVAELHPCPENPRKITKPDFERLVDSLRINGFWEHRPLALVERDGQLVVLCGNQRLKAAKRLKMADVPTVLYSDTTAEDEKDLILRDNINNGDWDFDALQSDDWADVDFDFIGLEIPEPSYERMEIKAASGKQEPPATRHS